MILGGLALYQRAITSSQEILAQIDKRQIGIDDFRQRYHANRLKLGLPDNGEVRAKLLKQYVNEELWIAEAYRQGYHHDIDGIYERKRIEIQVLLDRFKNIIIGNRVAVTEKELRDLYVQLNTQIKARHLYASSRREADALHADLRAGVPFEILAHNVFQDPVLKTNGGLLGCFTVDDMDPAFEEAAFALEIGEISPPVKTNQGYSIIQVLDRRSRPFLTEHDYATKKSGLERFLKRRKFEDAMRVYSDSVKAAYAIVYHKHVVRRLFEDFQVLLAEKITVQEPMNITGTRCLPHEILLETRAGTVTIDDFYQLARFTSPSQRRWIENIEELKAFISGLVVRSHILDEAIAHNLHRGDDYREAVETRFEDYLLTRVQQEYLEDYSFPEDTLLAFYSRYHDLFNLPEQVQLRGIIVNDSGLAHRIAQLLDAGVSFTELARLYSIHRASSDKGGDIGFFTRAMLGDWAESLFASEPGEWVGPIDADVGFIFFQVLDKYPMQKRAYEEVREEVRRQVRQQLRPQIYAQKLAQLRSSIPVRIYPDNLMNL